MEWPFPDPPNTAVFTTKPIVERRATIEYVSHDVEDGAWQFQTGSPNPTEDAAAIVGLRTILELDPSLASLGDLPLGWSAVRAGAAWRRTKK